MEVNTTSPVSLLVGAIARNWWLILVRGLAAIAFGILCFVWPAISLLVLVLLYGVYAIVDGVSAIVWGARSRWGLMIAVGVVSVLAGLIALFWPGLTALALVYLIAAWAIVRGASEIAAAIRLRREIHNEWMLVLGGVISIFFGLLLASYPAAGALSLVWLIGAFAVVFGIVAVVLALRLRSLPQRMLPPREEEELVGAAPGDRTRDEPRR
jgi:uncharacterized membrane protein HdeD (DUF308 family)